MYMQVIEAHVSDRESLERQLERWEAEVRPGAVGFVHSTEGITDDDRLVLLAGFESADAARRNSERPEQGQWFTETEKCFDSDPTFAESEDVEVMGDAPAGGAGFVQVMKGSADRGRVHAMDEMFEANRREFRPDVLGVLRVWTGADDYVEAAYFTSEAEARAGEAVEVPAEMADQMAEFGDLMAGVEFMDLHDPRVLTS